MASTEPWYDPRLYASFDKWNARQQQCIAPTLYEDNRRCRCYANDLRKAVSFKNIAERLPLGSERDAAIQNFILNLCCEFGSHRKKLEPNKFNVLTDLVTMYGQYLGSKALAAATATYAEETASHVKHEEAAVNIRSIPTKPTPRFVKYIAHSSETTTVRDELLCDVDQEFEPVGQVYCAAWPESPEFFKVGYTASSATERIAGQQKCFQNLRPEAFFRFAFPKKIERLVHRELFKYHHEIVICDSCLHGHTEWFKSSTLHIIQVIADWYKLTQMEPLYDSERKLRMFWATAISGMSGDVTAAKLLDTLFVKRSVTEQSVETLGGMITEVQKSSTEPLTTSVATELLTEIRSLREELVLARASQIGQKDSVPAIKSETGPALSQPPLNTMMSPLPPTHLQKSSPSSEKELLSATKSENEVTPSKPPPKMFFGKPIVPPSQTQSKPQTSSLKDLEILDNPFKSLIFPTFGKISVAAENADQKEMPESKTFELSTATTPAKHTFNTFPLTPPSTSNKGGSTSDQKMLPDFSYVTPTHSKLASETVPKEQSGPRLGVTSLPSGALAELSLPTPPSTIGQTVSTTTSTTTTTTTTTTSLSHFEPNSQSSPESSKLSHTLPSLSTWSPKAFTETTPSKPPVSLDTKLHLSLGTLQTTESLKETLRRNSFLVLL